MGIEFKTDLSKEELQKLANEHSRSEVLEIIGLSSKSYRTLKRLYEKYGVFAPPKMNGSWRNPKKEKPDVTEENFKEEVEFKNGEYKSSKLLQMDSKQSKDPNYMLGAHGFNKDEWELLTLHNSMWNAQSKKDGICTIYSSRITVRPRTAISEDMIFASVEKVQPVFIKGFDPVGKPQGGLLVIQLADIHLPLGDWEYYQPIIEETVGLIRSKHWAQILLICPPDLFHNNDLSGHTAKGTPIEQVDMEKASDTACIIYFTLAEESLANADEVFWKFVRGNHDEMPAMMFARVISNKYPQLISDVSLKERKCHRWKEVGLVFDHGDRGIKELPITALTENPIDFGTAKVKEIHVSHKHHESSIDIHGILVRQLPSAVPTDGYSDRHNYVGSMKRFQIFEYTDCSINHIHYV